MTCLVELGVVGWLTRSRQSAISRRSVRLASVALEAYSCLAVDLGRRRRSG